MEELNKKTEKELRQMLKDKKESLRVFRFALAGSKTKNLKAGLNLKKEIAQILTVLNNLSTKLETSK
jgi:ribosomal protein L29